MVVEIVYKLVKLKYFDSNIMIYLEGIIKINFIFNMLNLLYDWIMVIIKFVVNYNNEKKIIFFLIDEKGFWMV